MIPPWHEGDYRKNSLLTHNARLENIDSSKLYSGPLRNGQRCVVVCEGYYEWKAGKSKKDRKQPYYIYATQEKGVRADDPSTWKDEWSDEDGWKGLKTLKMAGIFNRFKTVEGKVIYSCSIITIEANSVLSWLHHRAPVFLQNEEDTQVWLNEKLSLSEAVDKLNKLTLSEGDLSWHTVSTVVNNVLCKSEDCRKEAKEKKKNDPCSLLASWLKKGSAEAAKRKSIKNENDDDEISEKLSKKE